jgi:tRNA-dihydrouridine synthase B
MEKTSSNPCFRIGQIDIYGDLVLAPMDGFSDSPFRRICRTMGSAFSYSEFINAVDLIENHPRLEERLSFEPDERPFFYQIFDNDPERIVKAAMLLSQKLPDGIDINLGCSVRRVSGRGAGAGLLKEPRKISQIFHRLASELNVPVTAKIRLGWDENSRNYLEIARIIEESGGKMLAVHARTKKDGFQGVIDLDAIAEIKQSLSIPVIGNGDVHTPAEIKRMKELTQCDAVMIGRGAIGNPWIFQRKECAEVSSEEKYVIIADHLRRIVNFYGKQRGVLLFRKHLKQYLAETGAAGTTLRDVLSCDDPSILAENLQLLIIS